MLNSGTLREFSEYETAQRTEAFRNVAQRFSRYAKSWIAGGERVRGAGAKSLTFVRTPNGWRIAALVWDDE
jgi:ribosomal-protein-serine acetyltransferase